MNNYYIGENAICFCLPVKLKYSNKLFIGKDLHSGNLVCKSVTVPPIYAREGWLSCHERGKKLWGVFLMARSPFLILKNKFSSDFPTQKRKIGKSGENDGVAVHSDITTSFTP